LSLAARLNSTVGRQLSSYATLLMLFKVDEESLDDALQCFTTAGVL
jgi:hypothetical protein